MAVSLHSVTIALQIGSEVALCPTHTHTHTSVDGPQGCHQETLHEKSLRLQEREAQHNRSVEEAKTQLTAQEDLQRALQETLADHAAETTHAGPGLPVGAPGML